MILISRFSMRMISEAVGLISVSRFQIESLIAIAVAPHHY